MKKIFGWVALLMGMVTGANAQVNDTIQRAAGNDHSGEKSGVILIGLPLYVT